VRYLEGSAAARAQVLEYLFFHSLVASFSSEKVDTNCTGCGDRIVARTSPRSCVWLDVDGESEDGSRAD
jgi:hypothetical protein